MQRPFRLVGTFSVILLVLALRSIVLDALSSSFLTPHELAPVVSLTPLPLKNSRHSPSATLPRDVRLRKPARI